MLSEIQIQVLVDEIVQGYRPEKVYLFGSYAKSDASEESDIDLFIIKSTTTRKIKRGTEVRKAIKTYPHTGLDIIVYTPEEMEIAMHDISNIGKEAMTNGKLMYERV